MGAGIGMASIPWRRIASSLDPIGVQLYTVRELMRQDVERTLAAVAEIGYREVEFAGYFNVPPSRLRKILDANDLSAPAAHVGLTQLGSGWDGVLDAAGELGHRYVVTPWLPEDQRTDAGYRRLAELCNRAGEAARERGITFAYHNHDFEFTPLGDVAPFDLLLAETDPRLVAFEMDLFWITKGGQDPLAYFERHPGRFPLVHVKDMAEDGSMVDVGQGRIDFARIFSRAPQAGIRHYFVEHDNPTDPLASIRRSFSYLKRLVPP